MKDLVKKVAVGIATGALVAQTMVLPSLATVSINLNGNGENSSTNVDLSHNSTTTVTQTNTANVANNISASSTSGENHASSNTGAGVTIDTGNAKSVVDVQNNLNTNEAKVNCGGCSQDVNVTADGNGEKANTDINLNLDHTTWVTQNNTANVNDNLDVHANSGDNKVHGTTGGDVSIDTGSATGFATVNTKANANVAQIGSGNGQNGALDVQVTNNGEKSDTDLNLKLSNTVGVLQDNLANIANDVQVDANSGKNQAKSNTGGSQSISTGDAWAGANVDTTANLNVANIDGSCCTFDGSVTVDGNGENSDQNVGLDTTSQTYAVQNNNYTCGGLDSLWSFDWNRNNNCDVNANADSGNNKLKGNTENAGNDPSISTGKSTTEVAVSHEANSNVFTTGDAMPDLPPIGMGSGSSNWWVLLMGSSTH